MSNNGASDEYARMYDILCMEERSMEVMEKKVQVGVHDLYQMMIGECRYGWTRNNHLMPDGAYNHCLNYLPEMFKVDRDYAIHTTLQLMSETIEEIRRESFNDEKRQSKFSIVHDDGRTDVCESTWVGDGTCRFIAQTTFTVEPKLRIVDLSSGLTLVEFSDVDGDGGLAFRFAFGDNDEESIKKMLDYAYEFRLYRQTDSEGNEFLSIPFYEYNRKVRVGDTMMFSMVSKYQTDFTCFDYEGGLTFVGGLLEYLINASYRERLPYNFRDLEEFLETHPSAYLDSLIEEFNEGIE